MAACEERTARGTGSFATFRRWGDPPEPGDGAWDVSGSSLGLWRSKGCETGLLGYPRSGEVWTNGGVVQQDHQGGDLNWSYRTANRGPHSVSGALGSTRSTSTASPAGRRRRARTASPAPSWAVPRQRVGTGAAGLPPSVTTDDPDAQVR
ncbi:LGFP repeat-containing protein [Kineococcus sp. SYSU DK006]|uniref:LGFP repeat-containing protein n=1 Tax=Kineococcus sp. SYSU DK006 TaxID=3383127 RepID=UPI003D7D0B91